MTLFSAAAAVPFLLGKYLFKRQDYVLGLKLFPYATTNQRLRNVTVHN
jgi:hypothetical protein